MIKTTKTEKLVTEETMVAVVCDICCKECDPKKPEDDMEIQEFHHVNFTGGYASIFGDGSKVRCDICQHCLSNMIKDYIRFEDIN